MDPVHSPGVKNLTQSQLFVLIQPYGEQYRTFTFFILRSDMPNLSDTTLDHPMLHLAYKYILNTALVAVCETLGVGYY